MPAPTLVATVQIDSPWAQTPNLISPNLTKNYNGTLSTQADDLIVVVQGDAFGTNGALTTTTTGLTYTQHTAANGSSRCSLNIASAPDASGGTRQVVFNRASNTDDTEAGGVAFQFRGHGGIGNVFTVTSDVQTGDLSCSANSSVVVICLDWNAVTGSRTWATVNGQAPTGTYGVDGDGATWAAAVAYWADVGAAGTKTLTLTAPTFTAERFAAIEILAGAGGGGVSTAWLRA